MREFVRLQTAMLLRRLAFQVNRAARVGDVDSIHDLRVAIRRFSRCLRVFSHFYPGSSWKKIRHQLQGLMEPAGAVRDIDITLELLAQSGRPAQRALIARLKDERSKANRELLQEVRRWRARDFSRKWRVRLGLTA
jgi:CHAD domain-containing protein